MRTLISSAGLVVALSVPLVTSREAVAEFVLEQCTVVQCANGEVFCTAGPDIDEIPDEPKKVKCVGEVFDSACSEILECGRRVPAMSVVGLSSLGLAMIAGGAAVLRLRQRIP